MLPAGRAFLVAGFALLLLTLAAAVPWMMALALVLDAALLVAGVVDGLRARRLGLSASRRWPPLLVQGERASVAVRLESEARLRLLARDSLHPGLHSAPVRLDLVAEPRRPYTWQYDVVPRRRGTHAVGPLTVRVLGPWGLAWAQRDLLPPEDVRVYPQVRWEGRVGRLLVLAHRRELGRAPVAQHGLGGEPYGLKEYRAGDPPNRIHWKASARHRRLIAREETWERGQRVVVLLDCARAMASVQDERSKLDHSLAAALALARVAASRGDTITIAAFSDRVERVIKLEARALSRAYAALFDVEARLTEPAFGTLAEVVAAVERRRSTVVLFTSIVDLGAADVLRDALLALARRHKVILVNLEDPDLARLAFGAPATVAEAYAKVSAMGIVLANRKLGQRLRRSGIRVVTTPADKLAWGALESYLELFERRRVKLA
jgi:uncharacterized protein (DUF58 family)